MTTSVPVPVSASVPSPSAPSAPLREPSASGSAASSSVPSASVPSPLRRPCAVRVFVFWTCGTSAISRLIQRVDGSPWSHMGIGFVMDNQEELYFEALFGLGFVGPRAWTDVIRWAARIPGRRWSRIDLPQLDAVADEKFIVARTLVGRLGYHAWQLVLMYLMLRFGCRVARSRNRVVCSEAVSQIVFPELNLSCRIPPRHDEVTPASARRAILIDENDRSPHGAHTP